MNEYEIINKLDNEIAEREVLACLFNVEGAMGIAMDYSLNVEDFQKKEHRMIFQIVFDFFIKYHTIADKKTIMEYVPIAKEDERIEFAEYLQHRIMQVKEVAMARLVLKIDVLKSYTATRTFMEVSDKAVKDLFDKNRNGKEVVLEVVSQLNNVLHRSTVVDKMTLQEGFDRFYNELYKLEKGDLKISYNTGFRELDAVVRIVPGLTYIMGRPGSCKSLVGSLIALNMSSMDQVPTLFISAEMKNLATMKRLLASRTKIFANIINGIGERYVNDAEKEILKKLQKQLESVPMHFAYNPHFNINEVQSTIMWYREMHKVEVCLLDYFQLIRPGESKIKLERHMEYANISESMRTFADDLNMPIISLAQARRSSNNRKNNKGRLTLDDMSDTDKAARDAHTVITLFNDEAENKDQAEKRGILELTIVKARSGKAGAVVDLRYDGATQSLMNYDDSGNYENEAPEFGVTPNPEEDNPYEDDSDNQWDDEDDGWSK